MSISNAISWSGLGAGVCNFGTVRDASGIAFEVDGISVLH